MCVYLYLFMFGHPPPSLFYPPFLRLGYPAAARKKKKGHGETVIPPRSLFEKASMLKVRREGKDQKKNFSLKQQAPFAKPLPSLVKPAMEASQDNPEWLISEDWALLQVSSHLSPHSGGLALSTRHPLRRQPFTRRRVAARLGRPSSSCWSCRST